MAGKRNSMGQELKGLISLKVMSTPKIEREIRKKRSMGECSVKNARRVPKPKEPQAGIEREYKLSKMEE